MVARAKGLLQEDQVEVQGLTTGPVASTYPRPLDLPRGRHDNDKLDITKIKIIPTEEEVRSDSAEFLPSTNITLPHFLDEPALRHIDTYFRLLRHNIFGELKGALGGLIHTFGQDPSQLENPRVDFGNIRAYAYPKAEIGNLWVDSRRGLEVQISFPQPSAVRKKSKQERRRWWDDSKRLDDGVFLCLLSFDGNNKSSLLFLNRTGKETDPDKQASLGFDDRRVRITAQLTTNSEAGLETMIRLNDRKSRNVLIELPGIITATFIPILESLQDMYRVCRLPFRQWIAGQQPESLSSGNIPASRTCLLRFNSKQVLTVDNAKRYLPHLTMSSFKSKDLLEQESLSYQFLEHLLGVGIEKIIRIGGQSKSSIPLTFGFKIGGKNLIIQNKTTAQFRNSLQQHVRDFQNVISNNIYETSKTTERLREDLQNIHDEIDRRVLETADIIGVTTTGLAKRIKTLQRIPSKVFICEEAGEILEPHFLVALLPTIKHVISIGDHQQLRPQINNFVQLSLESQAGAQYQLDRSLFERLSLGEPGRCAFPISQLDTQRRMRPQISKLIQTTMYPHLIDHDDVRNLPEVVGMRNNVYFFDHDNIEDGGSKDSQQKSHSNHWEVNMTHALVRHIVRQGVYSSRDIAVLTPYTGQLSKLRIKFSSEFEIVLSDRDHEALAVDGFVDTDDAASGAQDPHQGSGRQPLAKKQMSELLRLATVDNFQGEEAKIVIVSMVRSNKEKKVGFLRTSNRINVLLSRAQHGLYLIGNADTCSKVQMWNEVLEHLRADDCVGKAFDLCCPRHPETIIQACNPDEFQRLSPEGGCQLICNRRLNDCGHQLSALIQLAIRSAASPVHLALKNVYELVNIKEHVSCPAPHHATDSLATNDVPSS
ncbi:hypothetical protein IFR05_015837 [Cadophora sp. M221]|nr:hypothetical protein IFR05_015837 [Cadophora sp. M221]